MIVGSRFVTVLRISATGAAAIVASLLFPIPSANSQPNWQHKLGHLDHAVARAFKGVKNCVARELEYGSYPSNVDDALRMILVRNCRRQYDAFFQACVATGKESEVCLGVRPVLDRRSVQGAILPMNPVTVSTSSQWMRCGTVGILSAFYLWAESQSQRSDFLQIAARAASSE
jgi:hypothetical protein